MSVATSSMMFEEIAIPQPQDLSNKSNPELEQFIGELFTTIYLLHDKLITFQNILKNESESKAELQKELDLLKMKFESGILKPIENHKPVQNSINTVKDGRRIPEVKSKENPKVKENSNAIKRPAPETSVTAKKPRIPVTTATVSKVKTVPTRTGYSSVSKVQTKTEPKINSNEVQTISHNTHSTTTPSSGLTHTPVNPGSHTIVHNTSHTVSHNTGHTTSHTTGHTTSHTTGHTTSHTTALGATHKITKPTLMPRPVSTRPTITKVVPPSITTSTSRIQRTTSKISIPPVKPKEEKDSKITNGKPKPTTSSLVPQKGKESVSKPAITVKEDMKVISVNNETTSQVASPVPIETVSTLTLETLSKQETQETEKLESKEIERQESLESLQDSQENEQIESKENINEDHMEVEPVDNEKHSHEEILNFEETNDESMNNHEESSNKDENFEEANNLKSIEISDASEKEVITDEVMSVAESHNEISLPEEVISNEVTSVSETHNEISLPEEEAPRVEIPQVSETQATLPEETPASPKFTTKQFLVPPVSPDLSPDEPESSIYEPKTSREINSTDIEISQPVVDESISLAEPSTPFNTENSFSFYGITPKLLSCNTSSSPLISPNFKLSFEDETLMNSDKNKYLDYLFPSPTLASPQKKKFTPNNESINALITTDDVTYEPSIDL